jgi:hypothetical protein
MNMRQRITLVLAVLVLSLGLLMALVGAQLSPAQIAGGWCGDSCADSIAPTPLAVAGGWCGDSCAKAVQPTRTPRP